MVNRSPIRTRSILTEEQQQELVADYQAGMKRVDIAAKYGLFAPQIYAYLRKHGVQANRQPNKRSSLYCVVCGAERPMPTYSPSASFRSIPTCGSEACKSILLFRPELRLRAVIPAPHGKRDRRGLKLPEWETSWEMEPRKEILTLDATELAALEAAFKLGTDESGQDITEAARTALWGRLSKLAIAVSLRAVEVGETSLTLSRRQPLHEFLRRFFGYDVEATLRSGFADAFDVVYLWRCSCPQQESYVVRKLSDFPARPGEYGVCSLCSSSALVIE